MADIARVSELVRVTPSSLSDLDCNYRHYKLRVKKEWPKRPMLESVAFGVAVHEVIRLAFANRRHNQLCVDHLEAWARTAVWRGRWPEGVDKRAQVQRVIAAVCAVIGNDESDPEAVEGILDLEKPIESPIWHEGNAIGIFSCRLDQTLVRASEPNHLVVREIKTKAPRIDLRECYIQLALAKQAYKGRGFERHSLEILWIDEDHRITMERVEDRDLKGIHAVVMGLAVKALTDTEHKPTPCESCTFCPLRDTCPAQKTAC